MFRSRQLFNLMSHNVAKRQIGGLGKYLERKFNEDSDSFIFKSLVYTGAVINVALLSNEYEFIKTKPLIEKFGLLLLSSILSGVMAVGAILVSPIWVPTVIIGTPVWLTYKGYTCVNKYVLKPPEEKA